MHHLSRHATLVPCVLVVLVAAIASSNTLGNAFTWDDGYNVVQNESIRDLGSIPSFFTQAWGVYAEEGHAKGLNTNYWRPAALTSYAIDHAMWGPMPPEPGAPNATATGFHFTSLVLHIITCMLVYLLGLRVFKSGSERTREGVLLGSLFFAAHPVHTEAVNVITYRTDILAGLFLVAGLLLWIGPRTPRPRHRERWFTILWIPLLYALGLASKEMAVTLPALAVLWDLSQRRRPMAILRRASPLLLVLAAYLWLRATLLSPSDYTYFDDAGPADVAATMIGVFGRYLGWIAWPWPLNPFYDWSVLPIERSFFSLRVLCGALGLAGLVTGAVLTWRRRPELAFSLLLFLVVLAPVSQLVPIIVAAAERFLYVAVAGPLWVIGVLAAERWPRRAVRIGGGVILLLAISVTMCRNEDWRTDRAILEANVRDWPQSFNAWYGLARLHEAEDRPDMAAPIYLRLDRPDDARRARLAAEAQPTYHPSP